ncbi:sporulation protein [Paludifilum halophilum]|uniref:Arrestin-like N-terminal domain-containing protein n=1 Tax=Paludifilum halophilum TaxID=1642702 RepID=A0A235BC56_9BACL|nr:sporulation protein [Paludifilum halophilum]OYD09870.1 hypothetical protein CHM34_02500 [Paludifilum halophilum]
MMVKKMMKQPSEEATEVNLWLNRSAWEAGETVEGRVAVAGGSSEQRIEELEISLVITAWVKEREYSEPIKSARLISAPVTISPSETQTWDFSMPLPKTLPISGSPICYHAKVRLAETGRKPVTVTTPVQVNPSDPLRRLFRTWEALEFEETSASRVFSGDAQEFIFSPVGGWKNRLYHVMFLTALEPEGIRLRLSANPCASGKKQQVSRELFLPNSLLDRPEDAIRPLDAALRDLANQLEPSSPAASEKDPSSRLTGAVGSFATGTIGGLILSDLMDDAAKNRQNGDKLFNKIFGKGNSR